MWVQDRNTKKWKLKEDRLDKSIYNSIRQDLEDLRFYSKCLDSTTYLPIDSLDNIYKPLSFKDDNSWKVVSSFSSSPNIGDLDIDDNTINTTYSNYLKEEGFTIKNKFTPEKTIKKSLNFIEVDLVTDEPILDLLGNNPGLKIDNVRVKNGHKILVKNQINTVTLSNSVDPNTFFQGNFYVVTEDSNVTTYFFYNEQNGIYEFINNKLVKLDYLTDYETNYRFSVVAKLGEENVGKEFFLSRLNNGYYPIDDNNTPIEFLDKKNWLLRNKIEYQNVLDIDFTSSLKHDVQIVGSYSVPERVIFVGEFGSIYISQGGELNIIFNDYKYDLKEITQTDSYYWAVGQRGRVLRINKNNFEIKEIVLDTLFDLNSIDFFNEQRSVVVGDYNKIFYTTNQWRSWDVIEFQEYENRNLNSVKFINLNRFIVTGNNGLILEVYKDSDGQWVKEVIEPIRIESQFDEFDLVEDIFGFILFNFNTPSPNWNVTTFGANKRGKIFFGTNNTIIIKDDNNFSPYDFLYLESPIPIGDIKSAVLIDDVIYLVANGLYEIDLNNYLTTFTDSNIIEGTPTLINSTVYNDVKAFNNELLLVSNNLTLNNLNINLGTLDDYVTQTFLDKVKPKMLYLNYDMGSKLNFYGDDLEYRLPNSITFSTCSFGTSSNVFESKSGELSWLDYDKDGLKTFLYNGTFSTPNLVEYNTEFRYTSISNEEVIIGASQSTNLEQDVQNLLDLNPPSSSFTMYIYDKYMIIQSQMETELGDVISLESDIVNGLFIVNRVEVLGGDQYLYTEAFFDETISNSILSSFDPIIIKNLNTYIDNADFIESFNKHFISKSYTVSELIGGTCSINVIEAKYSMYNAYYNLELQVDNVEMNYSNIFNDFKYTARYNIMDYLENINPSVFTPSKTFYSMPSLEGIDISVPPAPTINASIVVDENKIQFHPNIEFEYNSFWNNTFINVNIYGDTNLTTEKLLIINKYYSEDIDRYIIEVHKEIDVPNNPTTIDLVSRRTLLEISSDLNELNNIQRNESQSTFGLFNNYRNEIRTKFTTDSYSKIMLSDSDIKNELTALIYTDKENDMSLNVINLAEILEFDIIEIDNQPIFMSTRARVNTNVPHNLNIGDYVIIETENLIYNGLRVVDDIISPTQFTITETFSGNGGSGTYTVNKFDPYFNFKPLDIIDVSSDLKGKIAVKIENRNIERVGREVNLRSIDFNNFKFNLIDGLYLELVAEKFPWVLEAEIEDATIGQDSDGIIFYNGLWECGRWFGGKWYSGIWLGGEFYDGEWFSNKVIITKISGKVDTNLISNEYSLWYGGNFHNGTWYDGKWFGGRFINGEWRNGLWFNGRWEQGLWLNGEFKRGVWIFGEWYNGKFNCSEGLSTWLDGTWFGGDFECGVWKMGKFIQDQENILSRFGVSPTNSRKAIWESGIFLSGEVHSILNIIDSEVVASDNNKFTIWKTGIFVNGVWYGGNAFNIKWKNGIWVDGVVNDINILEIFNDTNGDGVIKLEGVFPFLIDSDIYIIDNNVGGTYSFLGTDSNIGNYNVKNIEFEFINDIEVNTYLTTYDSFPVVGSNVDNKIVSKFSKVNWINGIWNNGIFDGYNFNGGIFIKGVFSSGNFV